MRTDDVPVIVLPEITSTTDDAIHTAGPPESGLQFETLDGGNNGRFGSFSNVTLSWEKLWVTAEVDPRKGARCVPARKKTLVRKDILKGLSGVCHPGTFTAIMGASGAGKTTLLNTLARKNERSLLETGSILMNGRQMTSRETTLVTAYVQQEDFFIGTLTVKEVLLFHATLRMDKSVGMREKKQHVAKVIKELGLTKVANELCGYPGGMIRGISGGERKRLSVACELLMNPPLLFIDEPTSGLDSFMAQSIVKLIGKLAKANRTILCTVHQPTSEVFAMFDRLYLVAEGKCAFTGPCDAALAFFKSSNYPCPPNFNPADHYIFTLAIVPGREEECRKQVQDITDKYAVSESHDDVKDEVACIKRVKYDSTNIQRSHVGLWDQLSANFKRSYLNILRNPAYTQIRILQVLVLSVIGGLTYFKTGNDQEAFQDKSGLLFYMVVALTFSNAFIQSQNLPMDMPVIKREYRNGMYGVLACMIPRFIIEVPYLLLLTVLQWGLVWALAGLRRTFYNFVVGYVTSVGVAFVSTTLGYFVATLTGNAAIASAVTPLVALPFFLFGGLYQSEASTPEYFYPIKYLSWLRYGFQMYLINEFDGQPLNCNRNSSTPCIFSNGNEVLAYYHIDVEDQWFPNFFAMVALALFYLFLSIALLWCKVRQPPQKPDDTRTSDQSFFYTNGARASDPEQLAGESSHVSKVAKQKTTVIHVTANCRRSLPGM